jgi:hypothetical protein
MAPLTESRSTARINPYTAILLTTIPKIYTALTYFLTHSYTAKFCGWLASRHKHILLLYVPLFSQGNNINLDRMCRVSSCLRADLETKTYESYQIHKFLVTIFTTFRAVRCSVYDKCTFRRRRKWNNSINSQAQDTTTGDNQIEIRLYPAQLQPKLREFLIFQPFTSVPSACLSLGSLLRQCYLS